MLNFLIEEAYLIEEAKKRKKSLGQRMFKKEAVARGKSVNQLKKEKTKYIKDTYPERHMRNQMKRNAQMANDIARKMTNGVPLYGGAMDLLYPTNEEFIKYATKRNKNTQKQSNPAINRSNWQRRAINGLLGAAALGAAGYAGYDYFNQPDDLMDQMSDSLEQLGIPVDNISGIF